MNRITPSLLSGVRMAGLSFTDVLSYLLIGSTALALALTAVAGPASLIAFVEMRPALSAAGLVVLGYPTGFSLSLIGDLLVAGLDGIATRLRRTAPVLDDTMGAGVDEHVGLVLVKYLFASLDEHERPAPADLSSDNVYWMAQAAATLATDRLPGWSSAYERSVALLRLVTALLGGAAIAGCVLLARSFAGWIGLNQQPAMRSMVPAIICLAGIPVTYRVVAQMRTQLTRRTVQVGLAIATEALQKSQAREPAVEA